MLRLPSILLVDDNPTTNFLNQTLIEQANLATEVLVAENGYEALRLLAHHCQPGSPSCPALILLDVNMPVMNGFEFLDAYAQLPLAQHRTKIIVLTTSLLPRDLERLQQLPVAGVLDKPLTTEKLEVLMAQHFSSADF